MNLYQTIKNNKLYLKSYILNVTQEIVRPLFFRSDFVNFKRKNQYIVYKITNLITSKVYVGYTSLTVQQRWEQHKSESLKGSKYKFHKEIKDYFDDNLWKLEIVEDFNSSFFAKACEIYCIDKFDSFKNGYNSTKGGDAFYGHRHSLETRQKMSYDRKGRKHTDESKRKISLAGTGRNRGKKLSKEHCKHLSESHKGVKHSVYTKRKISVISKTNNNIKFCHTRASWDKIGKSNSIKIAKFEINGKFICIYDSIKEASQLTGICSTNIVACAKHHKNHSHAGGYDWEYISSIQSYTL